MVLLTGEIKECDLEKKAKIKYYEYDTVQGLLA